MKHTQTLLATFIVAISLTTTSLTLVGCDKKDSSAQQAAAQQQMPPSVVNVMPVQFQPVPIQQTFAGRTAAYQSAEVRPQASGIIDEVLFQEGSMVEKGQPLYRINIDNYQSARVGNEAALQQAQANIDTAKASYNSTLANLSSQQALQEQAYVDLQRVQPLLEIQAISQQQVDQAVTKYKTAQAAVANAQAAVDQAQANIRSAQAAAATAQAKLDTSTIDLNRTIVRAPISGKTGLSNVTAGALVSASQGEPLVTIEQLNPIYVDISQSSADLLKLKQQQATGELQAGNSTVELMLEDDSTYPVLGQLSLIDAKVNADTGGVTLRAIFPNEQNLLLPGMFVTAKLTQGVLNNAVLLPQSAIMRTPKGDAQVYIVDANSKIQVRPVTIDGTFGNKWIVTDGLKSGEKVVIMGGAKVKPEQQVVAKPMPPEDSHAQAGTAPISQVAPTSGQGPIAPKANKVTPENKSSSATDNSKATTQTN
ncbi:efflux RND transporter periplasmic adaptor subunit [Psychrobacter sp. I-STPA10]|uniref:efflux RND transporter periplasmic adaptor subunit n=1 Tax=Psychrobacter sp. I-STPA10 TaxID=2585769 RepID=UPI001E61F707|nr:efflux RND transporter periplasmic adaptor subunit [Psychrobacter sp. I-STPA10]